MSRASFPEIPAEALKSHAQPARVERVWRRLELDMVGARRARAGQHWWLALGALGIFAAGVSLGVRMHAPPVLVAAVAEPRPALPTPGAGPAPEPGTPSTERNVAPAQKRGRVPRALPPGQAAPEYVESYGEPVAAVASEPTPINGMATWEALAEAGDFGAAKAALDRDGGFQSVCARASASQLLVLADIARAAGGRDEAAQALKRVLSSYDSAPEAPLAAWTLGNLLEQAGDRFGAAEAYATYRRLSPTGDFAEDAAARQVDAALSQGNLELGTRAMEEYAQNFPKGRRLAELRKRLNALLAPPDAAAAPAEPEDDDDATEPSAEAPAAPPAAPPVVTREH